MNVLTKFLTDGLAIRLNPLKRSRLGSGFT
jgi:hypothetical protein